jgi:hypothetical protein
MLALALLDSLGEIMVVVHQQRLILDLLPTVREPPVVQDLSWLIFTYRMRL